MFTIEQVLKSEPAELLGDWHPLVEQLGSAEGLAEFAALVRAMRLRSIDHAGALNDFLVRYQEELLFPLELPAIVLACEHAGRNELRELIAFDQAQEHPPQFAGFAAASERVGRAQLQRLKPLRDLRFVQRYLRAVEDREARAWHTLVYGVTLSVYSLPLRQGLLHYGCETLRGFVQLACRGMSVSELVLREMLNARFQDLVRRSEELVAATAGDSPLRCV